MIHVVTKSLLQRNRFSVVMIVFLVGGLAVIWQAKWVAQNKHLFQLDRWEHLGPLPGMQWVKCSTCLGKGSVIRGEDTENLMLCPICFGVGGRGVVIEDTLDSLCSLCQGQGLLLQANGRSARPCGLCNTRGVMRIPPGFALCPECKGGTRLVGEDDGPERVCWLCDGEGMILGELPGMELEGREPKGGP